MYAQMSVGTLVINILKLDSQFFVSYLIWLARFKFQTFIMGSNSVNRRPLCLAATLNTKFFFFFKEKQIHTFLLQLSFFSINNVLFLCSKYLFVSYLLWKFLGKLDVLPENIVKLLQNYEIKHKILDIP